MKAYKTVPVPASEVKRMDKVACDLCGKVAPQPDSMDGDWGKSEGDIAETVVSMKLGRSFREDGGSSKTTLYDICPTCFKTKLMPWLEAQGAKPQVEESDW